MKIAVVKRDGTLEDFQKEKIEKCLKAAGLTDDQTKSLADKTAKWVKSLGKKQITTFQIRDRVVSELGKINRFATNAFVWYEKTKDRGLNSGQSE